MIAQREERKTKSYGLCMSSQELRTYTHYTHINAFEIVCRKKSLEKMEKIRV